MNIQNKKINNPTKPIIFSGRKGSIGKVSQPYYNYE